MRKHLAPSRLQTVRHIAHQQIWLATHRDIVIPAVIGILLIASVSLGFLIGHADPRRAYALSEAAGLAQLEIDRAAGVGVLIIFIVIGVDALVLDIHAIVEGVIDKAGEARLVHLRRQDGRAHHG